MPERAEIEVVRVALNERVSMATFQQAAEGKPHAEEAIARVAIEALDRVRDARGDDEAARLRAAAKRVLEADMRGVRDLDALNALEDAAGFSQQGQRRADVSDEGGNQ